MNVFLDVVYGLFIGFALGLTGGGGSIITLPVLVYLVYEPVHAAIGTSLAIVGGISAQGVLTQRQRVNFRYGAIIGALGIIGNIPGSVLAAHVSGRTLLLLFAGVMLVAAVGMIFMRLPSETNVGTAHWINVGIVGILLGFLTGFLGVGGGFLIVPALVLALFFPMRTAISTSLFIIFLNTIVALLSRMATSRIHWGVAALFVLGGMVGNIFGGMIAVRLDQRRLKTIFGFFVIAVGLFTAASALDFIAVRVK
ncbi:MAG: sulfite exporter TauE/SafE family protein [Candidatus Eremiobacteraeota bacterium]|nr:sulfite exporter TauE/SafE family protein [Candidatus Eremiobacteraeota bacterium]